VTVQTPLLNELKFEAVFRITIYDIHIAGDIVVSLLTCPILFKMHLMLAWFNL